MIKQILILSFSIFVAFFDKISFSKENCKRPTWPIVKNELLDCNMPYNHYLLYFNSIEEPKIIKKNNGYCYIESGLWSAIDGFDEKKQEQIFKVVKNPKELNIDHLLPYSFLKEKLGCDLANKVYTEDFNLVITTVSYNHKKSNKLCSNIEECQGQYNRCKMFNNLKILKNNKIDCDGTFENYFTFD